MKPKPPGVSLAAAETFVRAYIAEHNAVPSPEVLMAHMGWKSRSSGVNCLRKMAARGVIRRRTNVHGRIKNEFLVR